MDRTSEYAKLVVKGIEMSGRSEYLCCKRHLEDKSRKDSEYIFDVSEAERHIELANQLTIGEGNCPVKLKTRGFQNFIIGSIFGWRKKRSKERRYREAYIQMARQNGKSFIAGELCNDFATFSGYKYGRIFCTATKQDQANIVWDEIAKFIESDRDLSELYSVKRYKRTIKSLITETTIKAIGRDTKTADGFRSICSIIDEYHAHPNSQMYKLMLDGQIGVENALTLAITTAGFNLNSPCYEQYRFAKKVISGGVSKESLFVYIAEMDDGDDVWEPLNWAKSNPLLLRDEEGKLNREMVSRMAEKAIDAKEKQGSELVNFLTKSLNRWVTSGERGYIDVEKWRACGTEKTLEEMTGRECYLGVDLSSGGDLTSLALVFPPISREGRAYVWTHSYMPELRMEEHEKTDEAPYRQWTKAGLLTLTSGLYGIKTDYRYIVEDMRRVIERHELKVLGVGYDVHNIAGILSDLEMIVSCDLVEIKQSARSLSDATNDFRLSVEAGAVEYDRRNELMTWSIVNADTTTNSFGEMKIDKQKTTGRIDPVDALIDAWKLYFEERREAPDGEVALAAWLRSTSEIE